MQNSIGCILVGEGLTNENKELTNKIKKLNLQDKVIPYGKSFEINKIMTALDLLILCSKKAFPMVLLEAMSSGVPCLSTMLEMQSQSLEIKN